MANPSSNTGNRSGGQQGAKTAGQGEPGATLDEFDLAADIQGKNSLQGDNQTNVVNQRQAQAGAKGETDGLIESFEKLDKDVRAERDLGKGNRSGGKH
ncbi:MULTISPECIES: hypothetical protein [unclassified Devosia]|uniref:hypothetical protein n=1 Tax=unclassified Devosia TaxID=196773 RepID=UPI000FDABA76|nr:MULTISPECIES: hypothetical protein [unclassified Devosia]